MGGCRRCGGMLLWDWAELVCANCGRRPAHLQAAPPDSDSARAELLTLIRNIPSPPMPTPGLPLRIELPPGEIGG